MHLGNADINTIKIHGTPTDPSLPLIDFPNLQLNGSGEELENTYETTLPISINGVTYYLKLFKIATTP